jgi:hypothetical protein
MNKNNIHLIKFLIIQTIKICLIGNKDIGQLINILNQILGPYSCLFVDNIPVLEYLKQENGSLL